jgi:hypothetical protein
MNTDTPRTDEWETYCDECYYHMWRVRRKNERGFDDGFHVQNGEGARQLVELLNKQDSELTAVTYQRDRLAKAVNAATILIAAKGRHNTMLAYEGLRETLQSLTTKDHE